MEMLSVVDTMSFNSRTREGCDCGSAVSSYLGTGFNSRTREGCDLTNLCACVITFVVSIHAPGRGATFFRQLSDALERFQFTHPGGVRPD